MKRHTFTQLTLFMTALILSNHSANAQWPNPSNSGNNNAPTFSGNLTLTSSEVSVDQPGKILVTRNAKTPDKVKILKKYEYTANVCTATGQTQQCGMSSFECGDDYIPNCYMTPQGAWVSCRRARYCCWVETVCVRRDQKTMTSHDDIVIDFSKAYKLWGPEEEAFEINELKTKKSSAEFSLNPLMTKGAYQIKRGKKFLFWGNKNKFTLTALDGNKNSSEPATSGTETPEDLKKKEEKKSGPDDSLIKKTKASEDLSRSGTHPSGGGTTAL